MGYEAVMTNAYTAFRRIRGRAESEGIHNVIGFEGSIMTDSGGYQVLEYGSVDVTPKEMAAFEEKIGTDIAIILDKPTGLSVTKEFAKNTVDKTIEAAKETLESLSRNDVIWTLPVQGGKYLDLVRKSSRASAALPYRCFALGSPVEVLESYDFSLLVQMILASKKELPLEKPFHLFGAGHPLIIPLAVALGCDMFDSASYMLYAKQDRYISSSGTIKLDSLEYMPCTCKVCSSFGARELKSLKKDERTLAIARHNLYALKQVIEETKQAIWEGRLWEFAKSRCSDHPKAFEAFKLATSSSKKSFEVGTPDYKQRGVFVTDELDLQRPEISRHFARKLSRVSLRGYERLVIVPETRTKPFLTSDIFREVLAIVCDLEKTLICSALPPFGLVPAELSDIFPLSQITELIAKYPKNDYFLNAKNWKRIDALILKPGEDSEWLKKELDNYSKKKMRGAKKAVRISSSYRSFKKNISR